MASPVDTIAAMPLWQRSLVFLGGALLIVAAWYTGWYTDAVEARERAERTLKKSQEELAVVKKKLENFEEERRAAAEAERQIEEYRQSLPMSSSAVDNLMQTFQQEARVVGMTVESWTPAGEEKMDFYSKLPVRVTARGNWYQIGEFFRRVSELRQIVSVQDLKLRVQGKDSVDGQPPLGIEFGAATYRFLTDEERASQRGKAGSRRRRKK